jgi:hypothetical protein
MQREGTPVRKHINGTVRKHFHRAVLGLTTTAALLGGSLTAPAQAATPEADAAGDWLAGQLTGGIAYNEQFDFDDIGLTLDVYLALQELGVRPGAQDRILDAVEPQVGGYVGADGEAYAAQYGKLLTAVQLGDRRPGRYAGGGLFATLRTLVKDDGKRAGRASDRSEFGNFTETIGQSFVVEAFALAGRLPLAKSTTGYLLKQQCDRGYFRESMKGSLTCQGGRSKGVGEASVDATAIAVEALRTARRAGVKGLRDDIRDAHRWLRDAQNRNGSFTGNDVPNANSTGLAASALAHSAYPAAARKAARWVSRRQVTASNSAGTPLADEVGAVAYSTSTFRAGESDGITVTTRDEWRRATAQAAAGLNALDAR